jgi:predicted O-linked N-acetylglucosamine transferase (SPINDLY family)
VVDLPSLVCFEPQQPSPDIEPIPDRPPTFGAFHRMEKISPTTYDLWAAVLKATPGSRLLAKCPDFEDPMHRNRVRSELYARGVDQSRLELRGKTTHFQHLRQMNDIDVMLDTFPHGAGMSAIETLYMGVPLITRQGVNIQSRLAASFLPLVDMGDCIATGFDGYVATAKTIIGARAHLAMLRGSLRERLLKSPLLDHLGYTRAVEARYREFWERWCAG